MIPFTVILASMFIRPLKDEDGTNEAKGEIVRKNLIDGEKFPFNQQIVGSTDGYNWIWRHLGNNYWKVVGKWKESPWSCQ